jgi:hypothetical protein
MLYTVARQQFTDKDFLRLRERHFGFLAKVRANTQVRPYKKQTL